jgi:hypothetical protein
MNTVEMASYLLRGTSAEEQVRAIRFVPKNGNIYVYRHPKNAVPSRIQKFVEYVEFLTNEHQSLFIKLEWFDTDSDNETMTFKHVLFGEYQYITVDKSKIVILG